MLFAMLADLVVLVHTLFVLFVVFGALAALRRRWLLWFHLPAVVWGVAIELGGWVCPLTHLENRFRRLGGVEGYSGTFIEQYLEPVLYPAGFTPSSHLVLGFLALLVNVALYVNLWQRFYRK